MIVLPLYEGEIVSYDRPRREVRVRLPSLTDRAELQPLADIMYPIGDDPRKTEIHIEEGDLVWCVLKNNNPNYPMIIGYRCPKTNNIVGLRSFFQENIELVATESITLSSGQAVLIEAGDSITLNTNHFEVNAESSVFNSNVSVNGNLDVSGSVTANGIIKSLSDVVAKTISLFSHLHDRVLIAAGGTGLPVASGGGGGGGGGGSATVSAYTAYDFSGAEIESIKEVFAQVSTDQEGLFNFELPASAGITSIKSFEICPVGMNLRYMVAEASATRISGKVVREMPVALVGQTVESVQVDVFVSVKGV